MAETDYLFEGSSQKYNQTQELLANISSGERELDPNSWRPLAAFLKTPVYGEILRAVGEGTIIGSFPPLILNPDSFEAFGRNPGESTLDYRRCSDCDVATWVSLDVIVSRLKDYHLTAVVYHQGEAAWKAERGRELYTSSRLEIKKDGQVVASVFSVDSLAEVETWLKQRAFCDETIALKFAQKDSALEILDPEGTLMSGNYWRRYLNPDRVYVLGENKDNPDFDVLTKMEKFAPRIIERGGGLPDETADYVLRLLSHYLDLKAQERIPAEEVTDFEKRLAKSIARGFAVDPLGAANLYLRFTPVLGIFSPTLAKAAAWNISPISRDLKDGHDRRLVESLGTYGLREFGDRQFPQFIFVLPQRYPKNMAEVLTKIISALDLTPEDRAKIASEFAQNWPKGLQLGSRWIPVEAPLDFDPNINGNQFLV